MEASGFKTLNILIMTSSNALSWNSFLFTFHCNVFPRIQLTESGLYQVMTRSRTINLCPCSKAQPYALHNFSRTVAAGKWCRVYPNNHTLSHVSHLVVFAVVNYRPIFPISSRVPSQAYGLAIKHVGVSLGYQWVTSRNMGKLTWKHEDIM